MPPPQREDGLLWTEQKRAGGGEACGSPSGSTRSSCSRRGQHGVQVSCQSAPPRPRLCPWSREGEAAVQLTPVHSGPKASPMEGGKVAVGSGTSHSAPPSPAQPSPGTPRNLTWCIDHCGWTTGGIEGHYLILSCSEKPEANLWFRSLRDAPRKCQE